MIVMLMAGCSSGGGGGTSTSGTTDTSAPSVPASLTAATINDNSITLNWNASTDDVSVTGYKIYRGGAQIATSAANAYSDSGLTSSTTYTYTVSAYDAAGNTSAQSASASATTLAPGQTDTQAPTAPTNLAASAVSSSQINLTWTASTDDVAVAGYEVWQGTTKLGTVTSTSYSDTGLTASTTYSYTVKAFDGAGHISIASNTASATTSAAQASGTLLVKVANGDKSRIPNATVVLGDSNGVMISSQITDANGEATFSNPPANATVTAAATMSCLTSGSTTTERDILIQYDVNVSTITAALYLCGGGSTSTSVNVNITNIPAGATGCQVNLGSQYGWAYLTSGTSNASTQMEVTAHDLQSDGKVSIAVTARDSSGKRISYGVLTDITLVSGMTVTIAANQAFTNTIQYQVNNIPATVKIIEPGIELSRKMQAGEWGGVYFYDFLTTTGTSTALSVSYIPAFGDSFGYEAYLDLDQNNNGRTDSTIVIYKRSPTLASQTFDMSQVPPIPANLTITGNNTWTPTLSWSGTDSSAVEINIFTYGGNGFFVINASPSRTSVTFPQLPDSLASFRPVLTYFDVTCERSDVFSSYDDVLSKIDQLMNGTWSWPATYTDAMSEGQYSTTQTLAPAMNNAAAISKKAKKAKRFRKQY